MTKTNRRLALLFVTTTVGVATVFLSIALWHANRQGPDAGNVSGRQIGVLLLLEPPRPAPDVPVIAGDGREITLAGLKKGRLTVVNLWASWCLPCVQEMPALDRLRQAVGDEGITVLAVSEDATLDQARAFLAREGLAGLGLYHDPHGRLAQALGVQGLPSTYILHADGRIAAFLEGEAQWGAPAMITRLKTLAASPP